MRKLLCLLGWHVEPKGHNAEYCYAFWCTACRHIVRGKLR